MLKGAAPGTSWTTTRMGNDGGYPNGGLWRVAADQLRTDEGPSAAVVKRTGAAHLGAFPVWRGRADPQDPQWWGREAEFYQSDLATTGWSDGVRAAQCHVDDHDGCRDLWLEEVSGIPASLDHASHAAEGLARWQMHHAHTEHEWLSRGWIAKHLSRQDLDNDRTLAHPAWEEAIDRGLDPKLRDWVRTRPTDANEIGRVVSGFPQALANHDFHTFNIGRVDDQVVLIDWAYVGWGPIGHDAGHLALSAVEDGRTDPIDAWHSITTAYGAALADAGWTGDQAIVRQSMATSNRLRMGWVIDHLLNATTQASDEALAAGSRSLMFIATLP